MAFRSVTGDWRHVATRELRNLVSRDLDDRAEAWR